MSSSITDLVQPATMATDSHHHYLPHEITIEILSRLPVKSLLRFRCVCKKWRALISKRSFITKHSTQTNTLNARNKHLIALTWSSAILNQKISIFFRSSNKQQPQTLINAAEAATSPPTDLDLLFPDYYTRMRSSPPEFARMVGSCNGLVCVSLRASSKFVLWNPATRELRNIPEPGLSRPQGEHNLHFFRHGFGFDPCTHDFKMVRFLCSFRLIPDDDLPPYARVGEVYSKDTDSWRELDLNMQGCDIISSLYATVSGGIHWMGKGSDDRDRIVCFDLRKELFQEMPLPDSFEKCETGRNRMEVGVVDDSLAFFVYPRCGDFDTCIIDVWVMKEYGVIESWTKQFSIGPVSVRSMHETSGEIVLQNRVDYGLHWYNSNTQTFEKLFQYWDHCNYCIHTYTESLFSVKGGY